MLLSNAYAHFGLSYGAPMEDVTSVWVERVKGKKCDFTEDDSEYCTNMDAYLSIRTQNEHHKINPAQDWATYLLDDVATWAEHVRSEDIEITQDALDLAIDKLSPLPAFLPFSRVEGTLPVFPIIDELLPLQEFVDRNLPEDSSCFDVVWRCGSWKSKGQVINGQCKPIGKRELALWPNDNPPLWRIELNLPYWMLMTDDERKALIHHEMCHAELDLGVEGKPKATGKPHTIQQHIETLGRFGAQTEDEASAIAHAYAHPNTQRLLKQYGFDAKTGQGLLWESLEKRTEVIGHDGLTDSGRLLKFPESARSL